MRILMIGGTALIGPHVIRELFENNLHDIHTITRSGKRYFRETSHVADRRDEIALHTIIDDVCPDVLIDMIPFTASDAELVVSALTKLKLDIPVVAVSSIDVYAAYASLHRSEDVPVQICPLSEGMRIRRELGVEGEAYDKISVESVYKEHVANISIVRLPAVYGWPDCTRVSEYLDPMLNGSNVIRLSKYQGDWKFSRCFHKNAAHAIVRCVLARLKGQHTYNVADKEVHTERQWVEKIATVCGWKGVIVEDAETDSLVNWQQHFYVSSEKIRSCLGFVDKYSTEQGLVDTVAYHAYQRMGVRYEKYY